MESKIISVGTGATLIANGGSAGDPNTTLVKVPTGGANTFFGGSDVTTSNGFVLAAGESFSFDLLGGDRLYAVVASSTQNVSVLRRSP